MNMVKERDKNLRTLIGTHNRVDAMVFQPKGALKGLRSGSPDGDKDNVVEQLLVPEVLTRTNLLGLAYGKGKEGQPLLTVLRFDTTVSADPLQHTLAAVYLLLSSRQEKKIFASLAIAAFLAMALRATSSENHAMAVLDHLAGLHTPAGEQPCLLLQNRLLGGLLYHNVRPFMDKGGMNVLEPGHNFLLGTPLAGATSPKLAEEAQFLAGALATLAHDPQLNADNNDDDYMTPMAQLTLALYDLDVLSTDEGSVINKPASIISRLLEANLSRSVSRSDGNLRVSNFWQGTGASYEEIIS